MKKKLLIFMSLLICVATLAFAERRTRVDTYKNYTIKHIWNDNNTSGPSSSSNNYAKTIYDDEIARWNSVTHYLYHLNPNSTVRGVNVLIYANANGPYLVYVTQYKEGMWEILFQEETYDYNSVRHSIDDFCSLYDAAIAAGM